MEKITKNTLVSLALSMETQGGEVMSQREELIYLHGGYGQIFAKLETQLEGKTQGALFSVLLSIDEAFGAYDEALLIDEALEDLPQDVAVGMELESEDGKVWMVEGVEGSKFRLNANHALAGLPLRVQREVLEIEQLSDEAAREILEMQHTH